MKEIGDQSRKNTGSKKGNTQGCTEIGDKTRTRQGQGGDKDEARARTRTKARTRTRTRVRTRARQGRGQQSDGSMRCLGGGVMR